VIIALCMRPVRRNTMAREGMTALRAFLLHAGWPGSDDELENTTVWLCDQVQLL